MGDVGLPAAKRIRVLLVDDHLIVRQGLSALLGGEPDLDLIGEASSGEEGLARAAELVPDIVLLDVTLRRADQGGPSAMDGIELTRRLRVAQPGAAVLVLSMHDDPIIVSSAVRAGARGYVVKGHGIGDLLHAIRVVHRGGAYWGPTAGPPTAAPPSGHEIALSYREREILQLLTEGLTGPQIADRLGLKSKTIENHRARIMDKLDIHTTAGLVRYAIRSGIAR